MKNAIYIETEGKRLRATNQSLIIESIDKADLDIPLIDIDSLIIKGGTTLTSHSILKIIEYGITITFLDYYGNYSCSIYSDIMGNVEVRHNQLRLSDDKHRSLQLASVIIQGKISNQIAVLKRYIRNYGDNKEINTSIDRLYAYRDNIKDATSIEAIRGYEGISSREYFSTFNLLIRRKEFKFNGRVYHPCTDSINAMLSFTYGLLRHEVEKYIHICGLDPYVGFIHSERSGKESLSLDLMEEYRAYLTDRIVITSINNREVDINDFEIDARYGVVCNSDCRSKMIKSWESKKRQSLLYNGKNITYSDLIHNQVRLLVKHIKGVDTYRPFIWR